MSSVAPNNSTTTNSNSSNTHSDPKTQVLNEQIANILGSRDPLDSPVFDHTLHINTIFPTEQSFAQADKVMNKMKQKIRAMEKEMRELLREQTEGVNIGKRKELELVNQYIQKLCDDINDIKVKALHAEETVQAITKDIKSLDCAKKNLVTSVTVVRRLQMLVNAVDQLREVVVKRDYAAIAPLIQAVNQLSVQFATFKAVPQVNSLLEAVKSISADLKSNMTSVFENSFNSQGNLTGNASELRDICLIIDVMEANMKSHTLEWYVDLQLREYRSIFRPEDEVGNLENIPRRFAFLKRILKSYDEEQVAIFPKEWNVSELVCKRFCQYTKEHFKSLLASKTSVLDVKLLIKSLQTVQEFEVSLNKRFTHVQGMDEDGKMAVEIPNIFTGELSSAFEPYMYLYIDAEDKNLNEMVEKFKLNTVLSEEDLNTGVFSASTDLFYFYKQTLISMAKLNTKKPFVDLCKLFGKWLINFCDILTNKIPKFDEKKIVTSDEVKLTCIILNTAEYCHNTTAQLEEKILEKVDPELKEMIDMNKEKELFLLLVTNSIQSLVKLIANTLNPALQNMTKIPWASMQNVGDQSEYVRVIAQTLSRNIQDIRKLITTAKHFKWFCDKFVDYFLPVFVKNIYSCKPISEAGAEQMLLDAHSIKTLLLDLPGIGAEEKQSAPAAYAKFVIKGMAKVETLLKIVLTPLDPPELIIKNYMILSTDQANTDSSENQQKPGQQSSTAATQPPQQQWTSQKINEMKEGFIRILDLKGVKKYDQQTLIDLLMKRMPKTTTNPVTFVSSSTTISPISPTSSPMTPATPVFTVASSSSTPSSATTSNASNVIKPIKISEAGAKLNENFKKLASVMDIKTNWIRRD